MEKEIVQEEDEKEAQAIDDEDLDEKEQRAIRYKRLTHLLDRSKFYSNFLLERMAAKKEEEKIKVTDELLKMIATLAFNVFSAGGA